MPMMMPPLSPQEKNKAVAHARLELLSNASLLQNVMDINTMSSSNIISATNSKEQEGWNSKSSSFSEEEGTSCWDSNFTPPKFKGRVRRNSHEPTAAGESTAGVVEKSSPAPSPASVIAPSASFPMPSSSSYASLLSGISTYNSHQQQQQQLSQQLSVALAQLPHIQKTAAALMAHHGNHLTASSSAFRKASSKENVSPSIMEQQKQQSAGEQQQGGGGSLSYEALLMENIRLKEQLQQKDETIETLKSKADSLEKQIGELRQLPTGKISHIPIEDMIRIMQEYGSEVSNQTLPKRKQPIQKASIVRQFRRWNPEFFRYFVHVNGEWVPRLGKEGELKRREEKRRFLQEHKKVRRSVSPNSCASSSCSSI